jgi:hypothetical protein
MKKRWLIVSVSIVVILATIVVLLFATGILVTDYSAQRGFENSVIWHNKKEVIV